ncbi:MAG: NHL repeat-containing protein [Bdellovibrionales bacterium]|nr:NHL repeat-containing protein [Bdellovibrionales bacterium]
MRPFAVVLGQSDFTGNLAGTSASTLNNPMDVYYDGAHVIVADVMNNRVLIWNSLPQTNGQPADLVLGQPDFTSATANNGGLNGAALSSPTAVCSDGTRLYVADTGNNRVLLWNTFPTLNQEPASLAIGQVDLVSAPASTTQGGLSGPRDVACEVGLVVVDQGNHRVVIWNSVPIASGQNASVVIGQADFTTATPGASTVQMNTPSSVATDGVRVAVSESSNNRVLLWTSFPGSNADPADLVLGQPDFVTIIGNNGGVSSSSLLGPRGVAIGMDRLWVSDTNNGRILSWDGFPQANFEDATGLFGQAGFGDAFPNGGESTAQGVYDSARGIHVFGEVFLVADLNNNRVQIFSQATLLGD